MFSLTLEQYHAIDTLRDNPKALLAMLQNWINALTPAERNNIEETSAQYLQGALLNIAKQPEFFQEAALLVAKIYDDSFADMDNDNLENQFKCFFLPESNVISMDLRKETLKLLMDLSRENKKTLNTAFCIFELILPGDNAEYRQYILQLIEQALDAAIVLKNSLSIMKIRDFFQETLSDFIVEDQFSLPFVAIIKKLGFSQRLWIVLTEIDINGLTEAEATAYFEIIDILSPRHLKDKISGFIFADTLPFPPAGTISDSDVRAFMNGSVPMSKLLRQCANNTTSNDMHFRKKCALDLMEQITKLTDTPADNNIFTEIFEMLRRYSYQLAAEEGQNEKMDFFAVTLAQMLPEFRINTALLYCVKILEVGKPKFNFAMTFISSVYSRFATAIVYIFREKQHLLVTHRILITTSNDNSLDIEWTPIAKLLFKGDLNQHTSAELDKFMATLDNSAQEFLCAALIGRIEVSESSQKWAKEKLFQLHQLHVISSSLKRTLSNTTGSEKKAKRFKPSDFKMPLLPYWNAFFTPIQEVKNYTAIYGETVFAFEEESVAGDGWCSFTASNISPKDLSNVLLSMSDRKEVRSSFVPEISAYYFDAQMKFNQYFPNHVTPMKLIMSVQEQLTELQIKIGNANPELEDRSLEYRISNLPDGEDKHALIQIKETIEQLQEHLNEFFQEKSVYETYVYRYATEGWGSNNSLMHYVKEKSMIQGETIKLCIWQNNARDNNINAKNLGNNTLTLMEFNGNPLDNDMRHIIFKFGHYDRLQRINPSLQINVSSSSSAPLVQAPNPKWTTFRPKS